MTYWFGAFTTKASILLPTPIAAKPALLPSAVSRLPGYSLLDVDEVSAFVVKRTTIGFRAWTVALAFVPLGSTSTRVDATYRPMGAGRDNPAALLKRLFNELEASAEETNDQGRL